MPKRIYSLRTKRSLIRQTGFFTLPLYHRFVNKFLKSGRKNLINHKFYGLQKKIIHHLIKKKLSFNLQFNYKLSKNATKLWTYLDKFFFCQKDPFFTRTWKPRPKRKYKSISTTQQKKYDARTKHRNKEVLLPTRKKKQYVNIISLLSQQVKITKIKEKGILGKKAKYKIYIRTTLKNKLFAAVINSVKNISKLKIKRMRKQYLVTTLINTVRKGRPRQIFVRYKRNI